MVQITTDGLFICPNHNITLSTSNLNFINYFYHFNHPPSFNNIIFPYDKECWGNEVCHGAELPFVFGPNLNPLNSSYTYNETLLVNNIQQYWTNFGINYNPGININSQNQILWQQFNNINQSTMILDLNNNIGIYNHYDTQLCKFWDQLGYTWLPNLN